jgi:CubicO group peptidase (beta-lactamase class C family)
MTKRFFIISLIPAFISCSKEEIVDITNQNNLNAIIESEYKFFQMPGVAYAAIKGDSVVFSGAMGYANIEEGIPLTTQTRMKIASVSKTITATAIMQLFEKGLVNLDSNINNYLPFEVKNPYFSDIPITIRMLLTHTSSINDGLFHEFYLFGYIDYPEPIMSFMQSYLVSGGQYYTKKNFFKDKPGTKCIYSNFAITLAACIVEYISGINFNSYCKENIFEPLGMDHTTWLYSETPREELAIPYFDNNNRTPSKPFYSCPSYPDGALMTSVEDLSKFIRIYIGQGTFSSITILKPESIALMLTVQIQGSGANQDPVGLVFTKIKKGNIEVWGHDGGDPGTAAEMYFDTKTNTGYIVIINRTMFCEFPTIGKALLQYARN